MGRIDHDADRGEGELMLGRDPGHEVRFHVDRGGARRPVQLALLGRFSDRRVDADNRRVDRAPDQAQEPARPHRVRRAVAVRTVGIVEP